MDQKEIEAILAQELSVILGRDEREITPEAALSSLGVDSLSFVELLVFIEKRFKIRLMESGLTREDFRTVRALAGRIARHAAS